MSRIESADMDLLSYVRIISKRKWLIFLTTLVSLAVTMVVTLIMAPVYEASTTLLVTQEPIEISNVLPNLNSRTTTTNRPTEDAYQVLLTNQMLAKTYSEVIKGRAIATEAIKKLGLNMDSVSFLQKIDAEPIKDTQLIKLSARDTSPGRAKDIVDTVGRVFTKRAKEIEPLSGSITKTMVSIKTVEPAVASIDPVQPQPVLNAIASVLVGLVVSVVLALFLEATASEKKEGKVEEGDIERVSEADAFS